MPLRTYVYLTLAVSSLYSTARQKRGMERIVRMLRQDRQTTRKGLMDIRCTVFKLTLEEVSGI